MSGGARQRGGGSVTLRLIEGSGPEREEAPGQLPAVRGGSDLAALLDAGHRALAEATDTIERARVRKHARAVEAAARILGRTDILVEASILIQTAERTIAETNPAESAGRPKKIGAPGARIYDVDLTRSTIGKIRRAHALVDNTHFARLVALSRGAREPLTRKLVAKAGRAARPKVVHYTGETEWTTPPHIIESARRVMGEIDLDPASNPASQEVVKATKYFTSADDGLKRTWRGRVWLNPPYSVGVLTDFVDLLLVYLAHGGVDEALLLVNNATDAAWFHACLGAASALCLLRGRLRFLRPDGKPAGSPIQGQVVFYFGEGVRRFGAEFSQHGRIVVPVTAW